MLLSEELRKMDTEYAELCQMYVRDSNVKSAKINNILMTFYTKGLDIKLTQESALRVQRAVGSLFIVTCNKSFSSIAIKYNEMVEGSLVATHIRINSSGDMYILGNNSFRKSYDLCNVILRSLDGEDITHCKISMVHLSLNFDMDLDTSRILNDGNNNLHYKASPIVSGNRSHCFVSAKIGFKKYPSMWAKVFKSGKMILYNITKIEHFRHCSQVLTEQLKPFLISREESVSECSDRSLIKRGRKKLGSEDVGKLSYSF